jgi:hypothetical protein
MLFLRRHQLDPSRSSVPKVSMTTVLGWGTGAKQLPDHKKFLAAADGTHLGIVMKHCTA